MRRVAVAAMAVLLVAGAPVGADPIEAAHEGTSVHGSMDDIPDIDDPLVNHDIAFPVQGASSYSDDFNACRDGCSRLHEGIDILADKMQHELAAADGTVTALQHSSEGNYLFITGDDGWQYWYIHINNDTPGTDDGANLWEYAFAPGIDLGARVTRGQFVAYVGDSGNAEYTVPHLHFELHYDDGTWGGRVVNPYYSLKLSQGIPVNGLCRFNTNPVPAPTGSPTSAGGYWELDNQGGVLSYGGSWYGGMDGSATVSGIASTLDGAGYWVVDRSGVVTPFGTARSYGDARSVQHAPIVNITRTASGAGYWLLAGDGRVFRYGDAPPVGYPHGARTTFVGMNRTASPTSYWLLDTTGRVLPYGGARSFGNLPPGSGPAVGISATASGNGYWVLTADGRVWSFGDAVSYGSPSGYGECSPSPAVRIRRTSSGRGYWVAMANGDVHQFGDAYDYGDPNHPPWWHYPIVDLALRPYR